MTKFERDMNTGAIGEEIVFNLLKSDSRVKEVIDVREDKIFQRIDVDFVQFFKNEKPLLIEVKTDEKAHETGNIIYESISNATYNTIGCFEKTTSQIIYYYIVHTKEMLIIRTSKLRDYMSEDKNKKKYKYVHMGDNARGYLIPIQHILNNNLGSKLKIS